MSDRTKKNETDRQKSSSHSGFPIGMSSFTALVILGLIALWMLSGEIVIGGSDTDKVGPIAQRSANQAATDSKSSSATPAKKKIFTVRARLFTSKPRKEILQIRARSEADVSIEVRAETSGRVVKVFGRKGQLVQQGAILCKLDEGARQATLLQAQALVAQTKSDYRAAAKLSRQGFSAKLNVNAKKAALDSATASLKKARIDLDYTSVRAPFTGIIEEQSAKVGDYLAVSTIGKTCAKLVKLNPLLIVGEVSERNINKIKVGQTGRAKLVTGEDVRGKVRFISPSAKVETRTFRVELEVNNRNNRMRNGVTADIFIPLKTSIGHQISPAYLTLNDEGEIGVRSVDDNAVVKFLPVKILEQGKSGVWVTGLPKTVTIITTGQDYVINGQSVDVILEDKQSAEHTRGATDHERS